MYSRVANDAPSSRPDHPERTTRRLCRTPQPTLSSTSAVAGSDRAESTLGSCPPASRALDASTASTAPPHDRRPAVQPGIRAVSERARALPARPPQSFSGPSTQSARTAATADGSSRGDDPVEQGTSYLSFPLSAAAEDDDMSYTRRAIDSSTEGGARVHPSTFTHPRGMEGVRRESRTSPAAYWPGDSRFAFQPATAADDLRAGARGLAVPVAHPRYSMLAEREVRVDTLSAWQRADVSAPTSRTAGSTATQRTPSEHEDAATVCRSGTPQGPLRDAAGRNQLLPTRRTLQSVAEGESRVSLPYPHPEGALLLSGASPISGQHCSLSPLAPISTTDDSRAGRSLHRTSQYSAAWSPPLSPTAERVVALSPNASSAATRRALPGQESDPFVIPGSLARDVVSIAESVGASLRTVYDVSTKYITRFSFKVASIARDVSHGLSDAHHDDRGASLSRTFPVSPSASPGGSTMSERTLCSSPAPWAAPRLDSAEAVHCSGHLKSASPRNTGDDGDLDRRGQNVGRPSNGLPLLPYVGEPYATHLFPSVADIAPLDDGRSNRRGCDMSYKFESSLLNAATENTSRSTSQRTPVLEGGAGVLQPKSHLLVMEGASAEDVLPAYAETSAPGNDSRFVLKSRTPNTASWALSDSEKHIRGAGPKDKNAYTNEYAAQWARTASPIVVHMFSRGKENPAARAALRSVQGSVESDRSKARLPLLPPPPTVRGTGGNGSQTSSSTGGRDIARYERRARALRNAKLPMPTYDGCADLQVYEAFVFKWDSWIRNQGLGEKDSVELMYNALTGEALEWYLSFVAMDDYAWTSREIYQELYEYCFPSNFHEELRLKLMTSRQEGRPVKRFAKDLQNLAQRFSEIGHATLKRLLWDGVDPYIRVFWVEKGRSAEYDDYDTLVLYAHRAERREAEILRSLEGMDPETDQSPVRDYNPDGGVVVHAVRMRPVAFRSKDQPGVAEYEGSEYSEDEPEYHLEEESGHGNNEEELDEGVEVEGENSQQYNDEYGDGEDDPYYSQDESGGRDHESQYSQEEYYEDEYEEYTGEDEHQPDGDGDEEYPYLEGNEERNGEGGYYYDEEGEEEVYYYEDGYGDEDEGDGHNGEQPLNTRRNEYGEDEYESEGSLYEDKDEY